MGEFVTTRNVKLSPDIEQGETFEVRISIFRVEKSFVKAFILTFKKFLLFRLYKDRISP